MEQLDIEHHQPRSLAARRKCRLVTLRKYSLAICLLEAVAICLFVYLLLNSGRIIDPDRQLIGASSHRLDSVANANYRIYSAGQNDSVLIKPDLFSWCNIRRHDQQFGIACSSSQWFACAPIEQKLDPSQLDVSSLGNRDEDEIHRQVATVISTSKGGNRLHKRNVLLKKIDCKPQLEAHLDPCRFSTRLVIKTMQTRQKIIGWGGALTDSSIQNILSLTTNGSRRLLDDYFGVDGLRYNMIRITIGGSDFSARFYTNDDSLQDDFGLTKFKLRVEDLLYKIPMLRFIKSEYASQWLGNESNSLKLFASMWSPPTWMKTNNHFNKGQLKGSIDSQHSARPPSNELYFNALAELKIKFMLAYQQASGLNFWGLTVMNEPLFAVQPFLNFNTMIFPPDDYANYVAKYLGPKLRQNPQLRETKLIAHDDNRRFLANFTVPILAKQEVMKFIDGVATHSYTDEAYDQLESVYREHQGQKGGFFVLPTELCSGHLPFMEKALIGNWHRGMHYALDIIRSLQHSAAGWVDWNMVLDLEGGPGWLGGRLDAPVIVDKQRDVYHKSPMYYVLGQFSRYIPPGSLRLASTIQNDIFDGHFETVSFALPNSDHQLATVVVNNNPYPIELKIKLAVEQKGPNLGANTYYSLAIEPDSVTTLIHSSKM